MPVGLPPGGYQVGVSVQTADGQPLTIAGSDAVAAVIGSLEVSPPDETGDGTRTRRRTAADPARAGAPAGMGRRQAAGLHRPGRGCVAAGRHRAWRHAVLCEARGEAAQQTEIYLSLLDPQGNGVAGYEGWPLGGLSHGGLAGQRAGPGARVRLMCRGRSQAAGIVWWPAFATRRRVRRRRRSSWRRSPSCSVRPASRGPSPAMPIPSRRSLARTHGCWAMTWQPADDGRTLVRLYWEVLQPLLPPHHIFVHLDAPDGQTVAQQDGPPVAAAARLPRQMPARRPGAHGQLAAGRVSDDRAHPQRHARRRRRRARRPIRSRNAGPPAGNRQRPASRRQRGDKAVKLCRTRDVPPPLPNSRHKYTHLEPFSHVLRSVIYRYARTIKNAFK